MVTAKLQLLGPPALKVDDESATLHSAKTLALLAYLVLEAETPQHRETLAGLFWGKSSEQRARHSLRQALYSLRQALQELADECMPTTAKTISFRPQSNFQVDALQFLAAAESQDVDDLRRASTLYRGPLLEGVSLTGCPAFEEWLFFRRDTLEQKALTVLQRLVEHLIQEQKYREARDTAQRLVALNPLQETTHRYLIRIHAALGNRDAVHRQYRVCADVLKREMGVEPSTATQALYEELRDTTIDVDLPLDPEPGLQPSNAPLKLPFVGREQALIRLQHRLEVALSGQESVTWVVGEAGMGKTRLVDEFVRRVTRVRCLHGRCYEPEMHAPYTAWSDALRELATAEWEPLMSGVPDVWRRQVARLVPELDVSADHVEGITEAESRLRLLQGVVRYLDQMSQAVPLLLFFDDLHWADEDSLELLHYAARHLIEAPLLIVGTYRPEAVADNPHLDRMVREKRMPESSVVRLAPLERETVAQLVQESERELSAEMTERLYDYSGGNPFVVIETLRALVDAHEHEVHDEELLVPRRVQDLIHARVGRLGDEGRRVVAAAAVIGRPFDIDLLRRVSGQSEPRLLDWMAHLLAREFLYEIDDGSARTRLDVRHDYLRRVVYEGLGRAQRQALHRRTAEALVAMRHSSPQQVTEEIAHHFERAGDARALPFLVQAAEQAEALCAYGHATELYSRALHAHRINGQDDPVDRFELLLRREATLDRQGRRREQAEDVAALVDLAERLGDLHRRAGAFVRQASFFTYVDRHEEARDTGKRALALYRSVGDESGAAQALRELGFVHWSNGDVRTALSYARDALQLHRRMGDHAGEATALHNLAEIYRTLGSPQRALDLYEQAANLFWAEENRRRQGLACYGMAHALRQRDALDHAFSRYREALAHLQAAGDRLMISRVHHALASLHWETGTLDRALEQMQEAVRLSSEIGYGPGIAHGRIVTAQLHEQLGDRGAALKDVREGIYWLKLTADQDGLAEARKLLNRLERDAPVSFETSAEMGWVKSHVVLEEGKVYCEFESPVAPRVT